MRLTHRRPPFALAVALLAFCVIGPERAFPWQPNGTRLTSSPLAEMAPSLVPDGAGGAIAVWITYAEDGRTELRAQRLDVTGKSLWGSESVGVPICTAEGTRFHPSVIPDGSGGVFLGWFDQRIWAQAYVHHIAADGSPAHGWPVNGLRVAPSGGTQFEVSIAADGAGGIYACWRDQRSAQSIDVRLQRLTATGEIAVGWPVGGLKVTRIEGHQEQPTMTPDGTGGVIISWLDWRDEWDGCIGSPFGCGGDIYAQRILADGKVCPEWPRDGVPVCVATGRQDMPVILSDGNNGAILGWRDFRTGPEGANADVYAEHVTATGRVAWGSGSGIPIAALAGSQWYPLAVSDGNAGAFFLWEDRRPDAESLFYLNHVDPGGSVWTNGGLPVRGGDIDVYSSAILGADQRGGAYVALSGNQGGSSD